MVLLSDPSEPEALAVKCTERLLGIAKGARVQPWDLGFLAGVKCQPVQHGCWKITDKTGLSWF